jgi:Fur family iron response transcriptional regulator
LFFIFDLTTTALERAQRAEFLQLHDILPTQPRIEIAQILFGGRGHPSAEQIFHRVNEDRNRVCKATVYNTFGLFARHAW